MLTKVLRSIIVMLTGLVGGVAVEASVLTVNVPSTASIWLAGQADGTSIWGDIAPDQSPVPIDLNSLGEPSALWFEVAGETIRDPNVDVYRFVGPDGETPYDGPNGQQDYEVGNPPGTSLSGMTGPYMSLVGVFLSSGGAATAPPSLDFGLPDSRAFIELSPLLQQVFFVGDGVTGVGVGERQLFHVPSGTDILYLGMFDHISHNNNMGSLSVHVGVVPPGVIPLPATIWLIGAGFLGYLGLGYRRRNEMA